MKNLTIFLICLISSASFAGSGIDLGGSTSLYGSLNPSVTPTDASPGWIYQSTNGNAYVKQDTGASTNWSSLALSAATFSSIGPFDSNTPGSNGFTATGSNIYAQSASATVPGMVNQSAQVLGSGTKTIANIIDNGLTPDRAVFGNGSKQLASSSVTSTELGYVAGANSNIQTQLSANATNIATVTSSVSSPSVVVSTNDFVGINPFYQSASGTGAFAAPRAAAQTAAHPGVVRMSTGTTTTGWANLFGNDQDNVVILGGGLASFDSIVKLSALSNGTDTYKVLVGLSNNTNTGNTTPGDGVYLSYTDGVNSGNWTFTTVKAGGGTSSVDTGIAATTAWTRVGFKSNQAGTSYQAYIDGIAAGAPISTAANIPTGSMNFNHLITKSAGTTAVTFDLDWYLFTIGLSVSR